MKKKNRLPLAEKLFRIVILLALLTQTIVPAMIGMVAEAETITNSLTFVDETDTPICQLEIDKNETKLIGLQSKDSEDKMVQVSLGGLLLDQNQTNQANDNTNVTVAYSQEASNVIVNWQTLPVEAANENLPSATIEPIIKESANNFVWLAITATQAGTYTLQAVSASNASSPISVAVVEEPLTIPVQESEPEHLQEAKPINDSVIKPITETDGNRPFAEGKYDVNVATSIWDLTTDAWGTDSEITDYKQYYLGKGIKYIITLIVSEDSDETIVFDVPEQINPWGTLNKNATLIKPDNSQTTVSFGSSNAYGIKKPTAGIYQLEFIVNFLDISAAVDFDNYFNEEDGFNYFEQPVKVTINKTTELLDEMMITKAVPPRPILFSFQKGNGDRVDNDTIKFSIVDPLTDQVVARYTYNPNDPINENGVPVNLPEGDYKIVVDESKFYYNSQEYNYSNTAIKGTGNYYVTSGFSASPQTLILKEKAPDITSEVDMAEKVNSYGDKVKSIQTIGYANGTDSVKINFLTYTPNDPNAPKGLTAYNMKLLGDVVLYMLDDSGKKIEEVVVPGSDVWKLGDPNNERSGYQMNYEYVPKVPLQQGYKVCLETQWELLEPKPGAGIPNASYDISVYAVSKDKNGIPSSLNGNSSTVSAYAKKAILAAPKKEVYQMMEGQAVEANGKEVKVGDWIKYKIILTAEPADEQKIEETGQIKVTRFIDQLPEGLITDSQEDITVRLDGRELESWDYHLDATGQLIIEPERILYISNENKEARKLEIEIDVQVGDSAIGVLENIAKVETQIREDGSTTNWKEKEGHNTNIVTVKVKPDIALEKTVSAAKVFPDTPFTYTIKGQLNPGSGAMYHGLLTDKLPSGITAKDLTTRLIVKDAANLILLDQIINDEHAWNQGEKKDSLRLDLTQYFLDPMLLGMTFEVTYDAIADEETIGKENLLNQAEVSGFDPAKQEEYRTQAEASALVEVMNLPGKLELEKDVFKKSESESINNQKVSVGDKVTYTIAAKNSGEAGSLVKAVQVSDTVPEGLEIDKASFTVDGAPVTAAHNLIFSADSNSFSLNLGDISGKTEVLIAFDVTITKLANGTLVNTATAEGKISQTPDGPDEPGSDSSTTTNSIVPNLTIEKSVGKEGQKEYLATNGAIVPYIVVVRNDNGAKVIKGQIKDILPEGLAYTSEAPMIYPADSKATLTVDTDNNSFTYEGFTLEAGESIRIVYNVLVTSDELSTTVAPLKLVNEVTVTGKYKSGDKELNAGSDKATATVIPIEAPGKLKLTKKADVQMVKPDQEVVYTLVVGNIDEEQPNRTSLVTNVEVTDVLDEGLTFIEFLSLPNGITAEYDVHTRTVKIKAGTLKQNESKEISFKVKVNLDSAKVIPNIAEAIGENPPEFEGGTPPGDKTPPVLLNKLPDPAIEKKVFDQAGKVLDNKSVTKDMIISYKLVITNGKKDQTGDLFEGIVTDSLPAGLEYVKNSTRVNGQQQSDDDIWTDNRFSYILDTDDTGAVAGGTKFEITYDVKVLYATKEAELGNLINEAHVKGVDTEKTPYDEKGTTTVTVVRGPGKLTIDKRVMDEGNHDRENQLVADEEYLFYEIVVTNTETLPSEVQNVTIWDDIPVGMIYQKDSLMIDGVVSEDSYIEGQKLFMKVGRLKSGESKKIRFKVQVTDKSEAEIENIAYAKGQVRNITDPEEMVELPEIKDSVIVMKRPEITFEKSVVAPTDRLVVQGEEVTYRLSVSNKDFAGDLLNGIVIDKLPESLTYVAGTTKIDGKAVDDKYWNGSVFTYKLPIPFRGGNTIVIEFKVIATKLGEIENRATVEGSTSTNEPHEPIEAKTSIVVVSPKKEEPTGNSPGGTSQGAMSKGQTSKLSKTATSMPASNKKLPNTGEKENQFGYLGILLLSVLLVLYLYRKKKTIKKDN